MADNKDKKVLNVPALRFPEFSGEWNTSSIEEQFELYSGNTPSRMDKKQFDGTVNWITSGELKEHYIADTKEKISDEAVKSNNLKLLPVGTFVIAIYGLEADGVRGTCSITASESTISQACMAFISKKDIANEFLYAWYKKHGNVIGIRYAQGTKQQNLSYDIIEKFNISYPCIEEQKKLIRFISLIDERIATQNKIIEDLKKLKSAIVEMILCKQGGVLLKLGDVGSFIRGLTYSSEDIAEDINATTVIRANNLNYGNNVSKKDVVYVNKKPTEIQILRKGDIVICMANGSSSLVGKNSYYSFDDRQSTIGAFCGIYRSSQPLVKWLMQSQRYRRLVYQSLQGGNGAIANLNGDDILNMTFYVVEDKKSVSILSALVLIENSIAVNEKLQELYSMQKEYLLQHLFI